jgi:hypothetical protein
MKRIMLQTAVIVLAFTGSLSAQSPSVGRDTTARWGLEAGIDSPIFGGTRIPVFSLLRQLTSQLDLVVGFGGEWNRSADESDNRQTISRLDFRTGLRVTGATQTRARPLVEAGLALGRDAFGGRGSSAGSTRRIGGYGSAGVQFFATRQVALLAALDVQWQRARVSLDRSTPFVGDDESTQLRIAIPRVGLTVFF